MMLRMPRNANWHGRCRWVNAVRAAVMGSVAAGWACAEPGASGAHRPVVWSVVIVGAVALAALPPVVKRYGKLAVPRWAVAIVSIGLVLLWMLFGAPTILALGSIFLTGRTM